MKGEWRGRIGWLGERRRTVCSFCTESSKVTAEWVAFIILSYDEGGSATVMRYNLLKDLKICRKHCYMQCYKPQAHI